DRVESVEHTAQVRLGLLTPCPVRSDRQDGEAEHLPAQRQPDDAREHVRGRAFRQVRLEQAHEPGTVTTMRYGDAVSAVGSHLEWISRAGLMRPAFWPANSACPWLMPLSTAKVNSLPSRPGTTSA